MMKQTRRQFVRTLFVATQAAVASRFLTANLFAAEETAPAGGFNFLVLGDWGREGELDQVEVSRQMAMVSRQSNPRFIISVGDNFYEDGVASTTDKHWRKSFEDVYADAALQIPWVVILGNHDYHGNSQAQLEYGALSSRWQMPARYFVRSLKIDEAATADFFHLDTTPMIKSYYHEKKTKDKVVMQDVPAQMAWFKTALQASKAKWKIVVGHHPIYSGGEHGDTLELVETILPLLHEHGVQAYFNGHDHDLQHLMDGRVNLFCSGAGSQVRATKQVRHTKFSEARSGFMAVSLNARTMGIRMIDNHGKLLYATKVPVA